MKFRLIDAAKKDFPVQRMCKVLGVSPSGYFAWQNRPACHRQRTDLMLLAQVRAAFAVSNGTYGSPRMEHELRGSGLAIGRRRVARLMRENSMTARQKRRFKRTTDSLHAFPIAPNLLDQDFTASGPNRKWVPTSPMYGRERVGCIWQPSSISLLGGWSAGQPATAFIRNWGFQPCAGRSSYGVRPQGLFTTRTAAANIAPSSIRRNCETAAF